MVDTLSTRTATVVSELITVCEMEGKQPQQVRMSPRAFIEMWEEATGKTFERLWNDVYFHNLNPPPTLYGIPTRIIGRPGYKVEVR